MHTPLRLEIDKIDEVLEKVGLPESVVVARGGYGALTAKVRSLLYYLVTNVTQPIPKDRRFEALLAIAKRPSAVQHELNLIETCWDVTQPAISVPKNPLIEKHVTRIANTFPISERLLMAPETVEIDVESMNPNTVPSSVHDTLQNEIYMWITKRPTQCSVVLPDDAVQQSIELASQVTTSQTVLNTPEQFEYIHGAYYCDTTKCFIFDANRPSWTYTYLTGVETPAKTRVYIALHADEALRIGVHFVHIVNILLANNIRFSHAKGLSPNHTLVRKDSIVLNIHEEDVANACQLLYVYGKDGVFDTHEDNAAGLQSSATPGISTAFEPNDQEASSTIFTLQNVSKSFNSYITARVYPLVLERILAKDALHASARQQFQRELDRIRCMFCVED